MFTKGPWIASKEIQLDSDGIATIPIFGPDGPGYGRVSTTYAEMGRESELEPNARLIAEAPEQYRLLKLALKYLEHPDVQAIPFARGAETVAKRVRETISKTEGR